MLFQWNQTVKYTAPNGEVHEAKYMKAHPKKPWLHRIKVKGWAGYMTGNCRWVRLERLSR